MEREGDEPERLIKFGGLDVLRIDHNRVDCYVATYADDPVQSVGSQELANALTMTALVARQSPNEGCRESIVTRELSSEVVGHLIQRKGKGTQAVETHDLRMVVNGNKHAR